MTDRLDRLSETLRDVAHDDATRAPRALDEHVLAAFRASTQHAGTQHAGTQHPGTPAPGTESPGTEAPSPPAPGTLAPRAFGYAIAATLALVMGSSVWFATRPPAGESAAAPRAEITSAFMPLTYSALPYTEAHLVRLEVPRDALKDFGLAPADVPADVTPAVSRNTVLADVLVGEDGLARAVRFVRAERAPGVAP